jgi:hypothetical protein
MKLFTLPMLTALAAASPIAPSNVEGSQLETRQFLTSTRNELETGRASMIEGNLHLRQSKHRDSQHGTYPPPSLFTPAQAN